VTEPGVHRLGLLASAIAGRTLDVRPAGTGEPGWTDGTAVFVDPGAPPAEQVRMVAVQAALLAAGSLDGAIVRQLGRRSALARRYLAVEGHRALAAGDDVLPPAVRRLADRAAAARTGGPEASLAIARRRQAIGDPPPAFGEIRPRRILTRPEHTAAAPAPDQVRGAPPGGPLADIDDADDDGEDVGEEVGHLLSSPVGGRGVLGRLVQRMLRPTRGGGRGPAGAGTPAHVGRAGPRGHDTSATVGPAAALGAEPALAPQGRTYPEWDVHRRAYRPDWCIVHERDAPADAASPAMPDGLALRRPLARLGTGLDRTHRRPQGDDIDVDAAVEARVAALAGSRPDDAVYVESLRRRRDLAVLVLLDVSGSAGEPGPGGRTVHEHQRAAAAALTTALHDLGDRVALYAFNSQGRRAVHLALVKGFDDRLDGRTGRRLGGLVPGGYTRLGAAIRHGTALLEARGGTSRRLLLVLSDGFAYDHGYEGRYGEADARRALIEARRGGVGCLCISVGAGTTSVALQRVFGTAAHATVPTPDRLSGLIGPLFRAALRSAEAQRRTFRRAARARAQLELDRRAS
jgi:nitric oxide reductase NorD protein